MSTFAHFLLGRRSERLSRRLVHITDAQNVNGRTGGGGVPRLFYCFSFGGGVVLVLLQTFRFTDDIKSDILFISLQTF